MMRLPELSTRGRLSRQQFWLRHLTLVPLALWVAIAAGESPGAPYDLLPAAVLLVLLVSIWGRRLHDRGRSAWWLLAAFVPVIGALGLWVECAFRGSSLRGDRYGPPPQTRADYLSVPGTRDPSPAQT